MQYILNCTLQIESSSVIMVIKVIKYTAAVNKLILKSQWEFALRFKSKFLDYRNSVVSTPVINI